MGYVSVSYRIGGRITHDQFKKLEELVNRIDDGGTRINNFSISGPKGERRLYIESDNTRYGGIDELEKFLADEGIAYDHLVEEGISYFRPGMKEPTYLEDPVYHGHVITSDALDGAIARTSNREDLIEALRQILKGTVVPLPELEIVRSPLRVQR